MTLRTDRLHGRTAAPEPTAIPAAAQDVVRVEGLVKRYGGVTAVDGLSFAVRTGEIFGLLGPNGAGKTTTVEILEGLRQADGGNVSVLGLDVRRDREALKQRIGVQLQTPSLFPRLKVIELLHLFARFYKRSLPPERLLADFGLEESAAKLVKHLSGGQQQRLSVALALINDPELVFLDEPTNGLDPQARINLWNVVRGLQARGVTVMVTTHYLEEAERLCDRVAIIDQGRIVAIGTPRELIRAAFSESAILFRVEAGDEAAFAALPGVLGAHADENDWTLYSADVPATMAGLLRWSDATDSRVEGLSVRGATLEDVFLKLTGRRFRD
ncbi:MAG TPA: ABC transporter ATP-binding protein [Dehalococcoidia bacterium]|nr:ABC transporter ATP-binding protein [Dehalococcoidia bacterium]